MVTRVRDMLERSRRSLRDGTARQRIEGSTRQLLERSRATVAQFVGQPDTREAGSQEILAGVCSSVALRDLNLVDSLLEQLERMEADEDDPDALAQLYKLDHLATRLRRNGENLRVLAGRDAGGGRDEPASLVDVIRAGVSSVEHYTRVELGTVAKLGVVGFAADDISRLLAELLDNATTHSPPTSAVTVSAHLTEQGSVLVRVEDAGIGLPAARLSALNERLASAPVLDRNAVQHMGLAVVRRISTRHDVRVWLSRRAPHGTIASVLLPTGLVQDAPSARPAKPEAPDRPGPSARPEPSTRPEMPESAPRPDSSARGTSPARGTSSAPQRESASTTRTGSIRPGAGPVGGASAETTPSGLPRRVPGSLKEATAQTGPTERTPQDRRAGHEQLLADLGDFADGEQAARARHAATTPGETPATGGTADQAGTADQTGDADQARDEAGPGEPDTDATTPEGHQK